MKIKVSLVVYKLVDGKPLFLIAKRPDSGIWQYPTATCEKGEHYLNCAFREIKEELGEVTILNFTDLRKSFDFQTNRGNYREHVVAFEIEKVLKLQEIEFCEYEFLPIQDATKRVHFSEHRENLKLVNKIILADKCSKFFIFVAPTASGKSVIIKTMLAKYPDKLERVKTYMTRPFKRAEDELLRVYVTKDKFLDLDARGLLIEKNYHDGNWYGSSYRLIEESLKSGKNLIAEVDINGLKELKKKFSNIVSIFIEAPLDQIELRVRERGGHNEDEILKRLEIAKKELSEKRFCDYIVKNLQGQLEFCLLGVEKIFNEKTQ